MEEAPWMTVLSSDVSGALSFWGGNGSFPSLPDVGGKNSVAEGLNGGGGNGAAKAPT